MKPIPALLIVDVVVLALLKLYDVIDWSWWWVSAPFTLPIGGLLLLYLVASVFKKK